VDVMGYHEGEGRVQLRAGWTREGWGSAGVSPQIPAVAAEFLRHQRMLVIGGVDADVSAWASLLTGPAGFATATGQRTVRVDGVPGVGDPLGASLAAESEVGMLAIEPWTRRRMRVNGRSRRTGTGLVVHTEQVYSNCPKYIQTRHLTADDHDAVAGPARVTEGLTAPQRRWIASADTFFVATHAPGHGADVSHRGGNPGFVQVLGPRRLVWPDYVGNSMYMTLGNLELAPACGLLFLDWEHGHTLQLTGQAHIDWDPAHAAAFPGAQRLIEFTADRVVHIEHASPLRWTFGDYFRHNPPTTTRALEGNRQPPLSGRRRPQG
jgi:predicted pyridoxine 5'-phosphate oxidase superfamily flavin-nucleotide-binding protein